MCILSTNHESWVELMRGTAVMEIHVRIIIEGCISGGFVQREGFLYICRSRMIYFYCRKGTTRHISLWSRECLQHLDFTIPIHMTWHTPFSVSITFSKQSHSSINSHCLNVLMNDLFGMYIFFETLLYSQNSADLLFPWSMALFPSMQLR